ncbi:cyclic nucleotide-binding domain-containing protein [Pseudoalteromonas xiamenensis]|uniref:cyclic nucleotide-binding domain-containing protein n=1 Tax=Pseudoalteromonas xiamenensis TaxID=882626 RepID=UPI0035E79CC6
MRLLEHIPLIKQLEIVNRLEFFKEFTVAERQVLLESFGCLYLINAQRHAFKRFERDDKLYIVLSGELSIYSKSEHDELGRIKPGEFVGEGAFISHRERSTNAIALVDTIVLAITAEALTRLPNVVREKIKDQLIIGMSLRIAKLNAHIEQEDKSH